MSGPSAVGTFAGHLCRRRDSHPQPVLQCAACTPPCELFLPYHPGSLSPITRCRGGWSVRPSGTCAALRRAGVHRRPRGLGSRPLGSSQHRSEASPKRSAGAWPSLCASAAPTAGRTCLPRAAGVQVRRGVLREKLQLVPGSAWPGLLSRVLSPCM